jgi:hypothetical protein
VIRLKRFVVLWPLLVFAAALVLMALGPLDPSNAAPVGVDQSVPSANAETACYQELERAYSDVHDTNTPQSLSDLCTTLVKSLPANLQPGFDAGNWADCIHTSLGGIDSALSATPAQLQPAYQRCAAALTAAPPASALPPNTNTSDYVACVAGTLGEIGGPADVTSQYQAAFQKCASGADNAAITSCATTVGKYVNADSDFDASTICNGIFQRTPIGSSVAKMVACIAANMALTSQFGAGDLDLAAKDCHTSEAKAIAAAAAQAAAMAPVSTTISGADACLAAFGYATPPDPADSNAARAYALAQARCTAILNAAPAGVDLTKLARCIARGSFQTDEAFSSALQQCASDPANAMAPCPTNHNLALRDQFDFVSGACPGQFSSITDLENQCILLLGPLACATIDMSQLQTCMIATGGELSNPQSTFALCAALLASSPSPPNANSNSSAGSGESSSGGSTSAPADTSGTPPSPRGTSTSASGSSTTGSTGSSSPASTSGTITTTGANPFISSSSTSTGGSNPSSSGAGSSGGTTGSPGTNSGSNTASSAGGSSGSLRQCIGILQSAGGVIAIQAQSLCAILLQNLPSGTDPNAVLACILRASPASTTDLNTAVQQCSSNTAWVPASNTASTGSGSGSNTSSGGTNTANTSNSGGGSPGSTNTTPSQPATPIVSMTCSPSTIPTGQSVTCNATATPSSATLNWTGGGTPTSGTGPSFNSTFNVAGGKLIGVQACNGSACSTTVTASVNV